MAKADETPVRLRITVTDPVPGVSYSLQAKDDGPLDAKATTGKEALTFDFAVRVAPGPRFLGDQVRREGPVRRFVYLRIGELAGDAGSPWSRRMKIDIHDIDADLLARSAAGGVIESVVPGTLADGSPTCGTVRPVLRRWVKA